MNVRRLLFLAIFTLFGTPSFAADVTLTPEYLSGKWSMGGKEGCESGAAGYVIFHGNGTMEAGREATPMSVGFWSAKDDEIMMHMLVSPAKSDESNVFYRGKYSYSYLGANVLETRQGAFDIMMGTSIDMVRETMTKCD